MRDGGEVAAMLADARTMVGNPGPMYPGVGLTYEEGVANALAWVAGEEEQSPLLPHTPGLEKPLVFDFTYALPMGWEKDFARVGEEAVSGWSILDATILDWLPDVLRGGLAFAVREVIGGRDVEIPVIEPGNHMWARINVMKDRGARFGWHTDGMMLDDTVSVVLFGNDVAEEDGGALSFVGFPPIQPKAGHVAVFHGGKIPHEVASLTRDGAWRVAPGMTYQLPDGW